MSNLKVDNITSIDVCRLSSRNGDNVIFPLTFTTLSSGSSYFSVGMNEYENNYRDIAVLRFSTGSFFGMSKYIVFNIIGGRNSQSTYNYALCTSYENVNYYLNATELITEDYQICNGTFNGNDITFTAYTPHITSNTTYYLILWGTSSADYQHFSTLNKSFNVYYTEDVICIDNGTRYDVYGCYIDNGTEFELYTPYIDNGTNWEPL